MSAPDIAKIRAELDLMEDVVVETHGVTEARDMRGLLRIARSHALDLCRACEEAEARAANSRAFGEAAAKKANVIAAGETAAQVRASRAENEVVHLHKLCEGHEESSQRTIAVFDRIAVYLGMEGWTQPEQIAEAAARVSPSRFKELEGRLAETMKSGDLLDERVQVLLMVVEPLASGGTALDGVLSVDLCHDLRSAAKDALAAITQPQPLAAFENLRKLLDTEIHTGSGYVPNDDGSEGSKEPNTYGHIVEALRYRVEHLVPHHDLRQTLKKAADALEVLERRRAQWEGSSRTWEKRALVAEGEASSQDALLARINNALPPSIAIPLDQCVHDMRLASEVSAREVVALRRQLAKRQALLVKVCAAVHVYPSEVVEEAHLLARLDKLRADLEFAAKEKREAMAPIFRDAVYSALGISVPKLGPPGTYITSLGHEALQEQALATIRFLRDAVETQTRQIEAIQATLAAGAALRSMVGQR